MNKCEMVIWSTLVIYTCTNQASFLLSYMIDDRTEWPAGKSDESMCTELLISNGRS